MKLTTKKTMIPLAIFALLVLAMLFAIDTGDMHVNIDGDEIDGPLGALIGVVAAGGGMLLAAIICTAVAIFLGFLFAGLGIVMIVGIALLAMVVAAAVSPLLLPLLIPIGLYWFLVARPRKQRTLAQMEQAV
jgi:hypothetical protein